ncbi:sulfite exporter TauE/SafE family protein [Salmonella enterica]|nr:sulfite exporter TauE/SafE family protein [Salmonella enterica]
MMFGAFIGSATPVGGGVIAFPVLSFIKHAPSSEAATFCLAMQAFGMTAASLTIYKNKIKVNSFLIIYSTVIATLGYLVGLAYIQNPFSSVSLKIFFSSFWLTFGIAIYLLRRKNKVMLTMRNKGEMASSKMLTLGIISFIGGVITSWIGNGIDVMFFCALILIFSESESIATASAVVVMSLISIFSTIINFGTGNYSTHTLEYLSATIPIVIFFAPLGIMYATKRGDLFIRKLLLLIVTIQYLVVASTYFHIINNLIISVCVILISALFLLLINKLFKEKINEQ